MFYTFFPFIQCMLLLCGDVELNPGPLNSKNLSICHWNVNGLSAHNFIKLSLLEAYVSFNKVDIICISETFLNSEILSDDTRLSIKGYELIRKDHPSDTKRGGVCIYYNESLPLVRRDDISVLDECLVCELKTKKSKSFVTCLYRSPSQTQDEVITFLLNFETTCSNIAQESPLCSIIVGDFNAKNKMWWPFGDNNFCGVELANLSSVLGYSQLIELATNFEPNKNPTCIDLIFCNQPNLITESGVSPSLSNFCHHQIIFVKVNFEVHYPPPYKRVVWHFKLARSDLIRRAIESFDWDKAFRNHDTNRKVEIFTDTLLNIF